MKPRGLSSIGKPWFSLSVAIVFKDFNFNKLSIHIEGINGKLSDIDLIHSTIKSINGQSFQKDITSPPFFKKN